MASNCIADSDPKDTQDNAPEEVSEKESNTSPVEDEGEDPAHQQRVTNPPATPSKPAEEDNEFILDGFDFSTGLSICQALDLDEDEESTTEVAGGGALLASKDPSELGNALLKALRVGKEPESEPKSRPPQPTTIGTG